MINAHITLCLMLSAQIVGWSGSNTQFIVICHILVLNTHLSVLWVAYATHNTLKSVPTLAR
jgi:hypothetical protein